jgi:hypothetical protein
MYDPRDLVAAELISAGSPDVNVLHGRFSVQGYSSIVDGPYAEATGSHGQMGQGENALSPSAIGNGVLDELDTTTLVTSPDYLVTATSAATAGGSLPASGQPVRPGTRPLVAGGQAKWVFGETLDITSLSVPWVPTGVPAATASWRVAVEEPGGTTVWQPATVPAVTSGAVDIRLTHAVRAVGVVVELTAGSGTAGAPVITTAPGAHFVADGDLEDVVVSRWRFDGDRGNLAYFTNRHADSILTLRPRKGEPLGVATVRARSGPSLEPTSATVDTQHGAEVVRSVAMIPGWTASWTPSGGGASVALPVHRTGVVQAVDVPPGQGVVAWSYHGPGVAPGVGLSLLGTLMVVGLAGASVAIDRSRRPRHRRGMRRRGTRPSPSQRPRS